MTEIFPKGIKSTDIMDQELKINGFDLILGKVTEKCRGAAFNESCWCILRLDSNEQMLIGVYTVVLIVVL